MSTEKNVEKWVHEYSEANNAFEIFPIDENGEIIVDNEICITTDNDEKKAVLIASAPELLESLKVNHMTAIILFGGFLSHYEFASRGQFYKNRDCKTCQLIAKAEGRE